MVGRVETVPAGGGPAIGSAPRAAVSFTVQDWRRIGENTRVAELPACELPSLDTPPSYPIPKPMPDIATAPSTTNPTARIATATAPVESVRLVCTAATHVAGAL